MLEQMAEQGTDQPIRPLLCRDRAADLVELDR
jgi:hypothetical protein